MNQPMTVCSSDGQPSVVSLFWDMSKDQRSGSKGTSSQAKVSIITGTAYTRQPAVGGCSKSRVMKLSRKTSKEPTSGTVTGTNIGSVGAKGIEDGRRMGVVGTETVVGWSDEGFHNLH